MAGRYRALLIGNSTYPADEHNLQTLKGPVKDIAALNRALADPSTGLFDDADVALLSEATSTRAIRALGRLFSTAARDDVLLVYFSGHGKLDQSGRLHLCMQDTDSTDLLSTAVSSARINEFADASRARNVVVVLDCCHAGAFRGGDLGEAVAGPGRYVLASCRGTQLANDATVENGTSFFTQHLVDGLLRAAVDHDQDGYVTFSELYAYVDRRLREAGKQIPQRRVDGDGDLRLAKRPLRTSAEPLTPVPDISPPRADLIEVPAKSGRARRGRWFSRLPRRRRVAVIGAAAVAAAVIVSLVAVYVFSGGSRPGHPFRWPSALGGAIYGSPFVANGAVYVGDITGHVYALDAVTGRRLWTYPRKGHIGAVGYRPQVAGATVYVGSGDGDVYAINTTTGTLRWRSEAGAPLSSSPVYIKGIIYFGTANNNLQALKAKTGARYWKPVPFAGIFEHGPGVYTLEMPAVPLRNRAVYVGAGGLLYALNAATGQRLWRQPPRLGTGDDSIPTVSPDGQTVYVGGDDHGLYAINVKNGIRQWKHPTPAPVKAHIAVGHGVVYFASGDYAYAVKADGTDYWRPRDFGARVSGLFVTNGSVYVGSGNGIYCLDDTTGRQCQGWHPYKASGLVSAPVFNYGKIYFGTQDGKVYALTPGGSLVRP